MSSWRGKSFDKKGRVQGGMSLKERGFMVREWEDRVDRRGGRFDPNCLVTRTTEGGVYTRKERMHRSVRRRS